jgi:hypothetical protein
MKMLPAPRDSGVQALGWRDEYGQRYFVDFVREWRGKLAMIGSGWIIEHGSDTPRLTSCYPL